jgi:hypothetical protein
MNYSTVNGVAVRTTQRPLNVKVTQQIYAPRLDKRQETLHTHIAKVPREQLAVESRVLK